MITTNGQKTLRARWIAAPSREIVAQMGTKREGEEDVVAYAKERVADGWNTWALIYCYDGLHRPMSVGYRRVKGRLKCIGTIQDDVLTPRIFKALRAGIRSGERLHLTDQVDLEEWLVLYGGEGQ